MFIYAFIHAFIHFILSLENFEATLEDFYFNCMITLCEAVYELFSHKFKSLLVDANLRNVTLFL